MGCLVGSVGVTGVEGGVWQAAPSASSSAGTPTLDRWVERGAASVLALFMDLNMRVRDDTR
jgi:hypothetical protein